MEVGLPHRSCGWCLQTTWSCCIQKVWCWTFRQEVSYNGIRCVKKLNASESLKTCRKGLLIDKTIGIPMLIGGLQGINCLLAAGQPALRRQVLYTGFYSESERLFCWWARSFTGSLKNDCSINVLQFNKERWAEPWWYSGKAESSEWLRLSGQICFNTNPPKAREDLTKTLPVSKRMGYNS